MHLQPPLAHVRKSRNLRMAAAALAGALGSLEKLAWAQVVFSDNFSTSTLNAASIPTANSTSYDIASVANANSLSSIGSGDLRLSQPASSSAITQAQALFTNTPIKLTNVGDYVEFNITFTDTSNVLTNNGSTSAAFYMGLFSSEGGTAPKTDLGNGSSASGTGLNSTGTTDATGGVQNWDGYVAQIASSSAALCTRPAQSGPDNTNQDLLSNDANAGQSYDNPAGATLASSTASQPTTLTDATQYTASIAITLAVNGGHIQDQTYAMAANFQPLTGIGPTVSESTYSVTAPNIFNNFDGLSFGFQIAAPPGTEGAKSQSIIDVSSLSIDSNTMPEPAGTAFLTLAVATLLRRKSR